MGLACVLFGCYLRGDAVGAFEGEGGALSRVCQFGVDPAGGDHVRQLLRQNTFMQHYGDLDRILSDTIHGLWQPVHDAWRYFHHLARTM